MIALQIGGVIVCLTVCIVGVMIAWKFINREPRIDEEAFSVRLGELLITVSNLQRKVDAVYASMAISGKLAK